MINLQLDKIKFVSSLKSPDNIDLVIDETVERIMSAPISAKSKERIKASIDRIWFGINYCRSCFCSLRNHWTSND
mgnify:CR=1 FL=1